MFHIALVSVVLTFWILSSELCEVLIHHVGGGCLIQLQPLTLTPGKAKACSGLLKEGNKQSIFETNISQFNECIQMHCCLLIAHKQYKHNTHTGYQLSLNKNKLLANSVEFC